MTALPPRKHLSARERTKCFEAAGGVCHICGGRIFAGQRWEVSHPVPLAAGGDDTPENRRPAHARCHARQTAEIDAPRIAKTRRQHQAHIGAKPRPRNPMPGSRLSKWKRRMSGATERRTP